MIQKKKKEKKRLRNPNVNSEKLNLIRFSGQENSIN